MDNIFDASLHNDTEAIKEYLKFGNVNICDEQGLSLLHYAAMGNSLEVANLLIDNYINLDIRNNKGETPLFLAVNLGELGFAKLLCRYGADAKIANNIGETVFFKAILKGRKDMLDLLRDSLDINYLHITLDMENVLFYTIKAYNTEMFFEISNKYPSLIKQKNYSGINLLMMAIMYDNYEICEYLLKQDFNMYDSDYLYNNSLYYSARYASCDIMKLLLSKKPIIAGKNKDGETILDLCELNTHPVFMLIDNYINSYDYLLYKRTYPYFIAVVERNYDLLEYGNPDIKKRDISGLLLKDLINMVNDPIINRMFKL